MKRVKLVIAYDGTNYHGWQVQPNAVTVEEVLNRELSGLLGEEISVIGASRTDSGVHALGNVAVFDTDSRIPAEKISFALNQRLPSDIRIQSSSEVPAGFHPRKTNSRKTYEYRILNRTFSIPTWRHYSYFFHYPLDIGLMVKGAEYLTGEHDFFSFSSSKTQIEDTVRRIYELEIYRDGDFIIIRVTGDGFLYNMVRLIAGTLIRVGTGHYSPEYMREILLAKDRNMAGPKAPSLGLTLVSIEYEDSPEEVTVIEEEEWHYKFIQRRMEGKQGAFLILYRCQNEVLGKLLERMATKALRNGAGEIYAADMHDRIEKNAGTGDFIWNPLEEKIIGEASEWMEEKPYLRWFRGQRVLSVKDQGSDPKNIDFIGKNG